MSTNDPNSIIRISKDEALSTHVDDMLKRQMSMRGDPGVTRDRHRAWYYQNWFIFGLVGLLGALAAWGLLEPMFSDHLYFQGKVTAVRGDADLGRFQPGGRGKRREFRHNRGSITIKGENILLLSKTLEILPDKSVKRLLPDSIEVGDEVGVYVDHFEGGGDSLTAADFLVRSPAPQSPKQADYTLHQLSSRKTIASLLLFPLVAGFIGLLIGAADADLSAAYGSGLSFAGL